MNFKNTFLQTGLAVLLTGFVLLASGASSACFAQEARTESDSAIIARHLHEMKVEYALDEFSDHSYNAQYSDHDLDSILAETRTAITCGRVLYAPDSAFKIVVVEGQGCGERCHAFYKTWLHFNDGSGMVLSDAGFENVTAIEKLPDGNYLVWERMQGITIIYGVDEIAVTLLTVTGHEIKHTAFPQPPSLQDDESKNPYGSFRLHQIFDDSVKLTVRFDRQNNTLNYRYLDYNFTGDMNDANVYSGSFLYTNGAFVLKEETSKPYSE